MSWSRLEAEAPELAARVRAQIEAFGAVMLATLREDGSPQLDPIEPVFAGGELLVGSGRTTSKSRNLRADPRVALHALVSGADGKEPDVKVLGRLEPSTASAGWWTDRPGDADVYVLEIDEVVMVDWDIPASRMHVSRWTSDGGLSVFERGYP